MKKTLPSDADLKHGEWYWLFAPALMGEPDPDDATDAVEQMLCIGQFQRNVSGQHRWYVGGKFCVAGPGIDAVAHIERPLKLLHANFAAEKIG